MVFIIAFGILLINKRRNIYPVCHSVSVGSKQTPLAILNEVYAVTFTGHL